MIYGYINAHFNNETYEHQKSQILAKYKNAEIRKEQKDGSVLKEILKEGQDGDKIVLKDVLKLYPNRINIDTKFNTVSETIFDTYQNFFNKGIDIEFIQEPMLNSSCYRNALIKNLSNDNTTILNAITTLLLEQLQITVEHEINININSIKSNIKSKRVSSIKGKTLITQKSIDSKKYMQEHLMDLGGDMTNNQIMKHLGLARNTFFKYKKELINEANTSKPIQPKKEVKVEIIREKDYIKPTTTPPQPVKTEKRGRKKKEKVSSEIEGQTSIFEFL